MAKCVKCAENGVNKEATDTINGEWYCSKCKDKEEEKKRKKKAIDRLNRELERNNRIDYENIEMKRKKNKDYDFDR